MEWGVGGIALILRAREISCAIVDLTRGELGSRGTPEERKNEAKAAADFLGVQARENLEMADGGLQGARRRTECGTAHMIRKYRPKFVVAPLWEDRHPDHAAAGQMVRNSALYCTLKKADDPNPPHQPQAFLYYPLHKTVQASFVVDTTEVFARKLELLRVHRSQFGKTAEEFGVLAQGLGDYLHGLETRDRHYGSQVGVRLARRWWRIGRFGCGGWMICCGCNLPPRCRYS